jgi:fumarate reductase subunit C
MSYRRPISSSWWMGKPNYTLFMFRELTAVFVWLYLIFYLYQLSQLGKDAGTYTTFLDQRASFPWILFHLVALVAAIYHSVTWFNVTPKVIVVRRGEEKVPDGLIVGPHYAGWIGLSLAIIFIALWS